MNAETCLYHVRETRAYNITRAQERIRAGESARDERLLIAVMDRILEASNAASPEPVPAPNQAGEVALRAQMYGILRGWNISDFASRVCSANGHGSLPADICEAELDAFGEAFLAALATQPATSPMKMAVDRDWLTAKIAADPDAECDAGVMHPEAPQPATSQEGERERLLDILREALSHEKSESKSRTAILVDTAAAITALFSETAATPTPPTLSEDDDLTWFGKHRNLELSHYSPYMGDEDDQSVEWRITRQSGHYNDREWTVIGRGETPAAAITDARAALAQVKAS